MHVEQQQRSLPGRTDCALTTLPSCRSFCDQQALEDLSYMISYHSMIPFTSPFPNKPAFETSNSISAESTTFTEIPFSLANYGGAFQVGYDVTTNTDKVTFRNLGNTLFSTDLESLSLPVFAGYGSYEGVEVKHPTDIFNPTMTKSHSSSFSQLRNNAECSIPNFSEWTDSMFNLAKGPPPIVSSFDKLYVCSCGQRYKKLDHLKRHYRIHTQERPHRCPEPGCEKRFGRSDHVKQHFRACHRTPKT